MPRSAMCVPCGQEVLRGRTRVRRAGSKNVSTTTRSRADYNLVAGTAWLFARPEHDQAFDHLFIDEAGQVSLGHLVAMGVCARNIVLVGDQMQLGQPIQGTHPGESGLRPWSTCSRTTPPFRRSAGYSWRSRGECIRSLRIHLGGRLRGAAAFRTRVAQSGSWSRGGADPALKPAGLSWVPVIHRECRQKSEEEGARIAELVDSLLEQRWIEEDGTVRPLTLDDILVVSPYNMQVNLLQSCCPRALGSARWTSSRARRRRWSSFR